MSAPLSVSSNVGLVPGAIVADKYRIDGVLGEGGMGLVLSATHLVLNAPVAIKVVRDELASNEEAVARLLFEARAVARMRGAHIVRVLDVARLESGAPYIVMEQLEGSDLQVVLAERGALPTGEAIGYLIQACEGLAEAHRLGIIHRDLKPENLFLAATPEGVVLKILDFGISKDIGTSLAPASRSTLTKAGSAVGSPLYMSPEQMRAAPNLDARADIWSLGAILFELVTGRCPFEEDTPAKLCAKVMVEEAPALRAFSSSASAELEAVVRRCLQKEPSARFQSVSALADALRDCLAAPKSLIVDVPSVDIDIEEENPFAKKRTGLALLAVSALLVLATVAFWHIQTHSDDLKWFDSGRASAAAFPAGRDFRVARAAQPAPSPKPEATPPLNIVAPPANALPASSAPSTTSNSRPVATARTVVAAPPRAAPSRAPDPDSPEARYGL